MNFFKVFLTIFAFFFFSAPAMAAKNDGTKSAVTEKFVQEKKSEVAKALNVSIEVAESYLKLAVQGTQARALSDTNKLDEVLRLHAETLELYSQAFIMGKMLLAQGHLLLPEIQKGVPGSRIPKPLALKINAWAMFGGKVLLKSSEAAATAIEWSTKRFSQSGDCDVKKNLTIQKCQKSLEEVLDLANEVIEQFNSMTGAAKIFPMSVVKNMTY